MLKKILKRGSGKKQALKRKGSVAYVEGNSILHRLDPRTKFFVLTVFSFVSLSTEEIIPILLLFILLVAAAVYSGMSGHWIQLMKRTVPFLVTVIVVDIFFANVPPGQVLYSAQLWMFQPQITTGGVSFGFAMGLRLLVFVGCSLLFIMSTKYEDFVKALRKVKIPYTFSFSLGLALRSTTYLSRDVRNIIDAQRSRGLELDKGGILKNSSKLLCLFIPMTICLLNRSKNISESMQCRGFGYAKNPTIYNEIKFKGLDYIFVGMTALIGTILVWQY